MVARSTARRDPEAVLRFIERFAADLVEAGMARMPARIFAALLATDSGRLTSAEISELLQVSPAAISGAVRYLTQLNLVGRERERGSRRDYYRVRDGLWLEVIGRRDQIFSRLESSIRAGMSALGPDTPAGARMAETIDFFEFLQDELPKLLDRWKTARRWTGCR